MAEQGDPKKVVTYVFGLQPIADSVKLVIEAGLGFLGRSCNSWYKS